jgi:hypothetical protein
MSEMQQKRTSFNGTISIPLNKTSKDGNGNQADRQPPPTRPQIPLNKIEMQRTNSLEKDNSKQNK